MKESDYIKATNLAKARAASVLLADIMISKEDRKVSDQRIEWLSSKVHLHSLIEIMEQKLRIAGDK